MFAVAGLCAWKEFIRFEWVLFLCMGLFGIVHVPMQKGENARVYFTKPRTIVSFALQIAAGAVALHMLYDFFAK